MSDTKAALSSLKEVYSGLVYMENPFLSLLSKEEEEKRNIQKQFNTDLDSLLNEDKE